MNKLKTVNIYLIILITILFVTLIGSSYAHFLANIIDSENTTTVLGGSTIIKINYDGGPAIKIPDMYPQEDAFATKIFTVTGTITDEEETNYHIILLITNNTFRDGALKYTLEAVNIDNNGETAPSIITQEDIYNGEQEIFLGNASFEITSGEDKTHTYTLKLYFPLIEDFDHSVDENQTFSANIEIREGHVCHDCLDYQILSQYGGREAIEEAPTILFDSVSASNESATYKMEDDYGWSYYYRGAKDYLNNNLIFAEHQWKIVRVNGDGSIRIIYNGECPGNESEINSTGTVSCFQLCEPDYGWGEFWCWGNEYNVDNDNKFIGYMYGSKSIPTTSYESAHANQVSSEVKSRVDSWYSNNIFDTVYEPFISDTLFCNDRQLQSNVGGEATGAGFGSEDTIYAGYYRLEANKQPTLKCNLKNDKLTVSDEKNGNAALKYPVGLLTADEAAISGLRFGISNSTNYLNIAERYWTLTPRDAQTYEGHTSLVLYQIWAGGQLDYYVTDYPVGIRGVINLKSKTKVTGTGTVADPFKVKID